MSLPLLFGARIPVIVENKPSNNDGGFRRAYSESVCLLESKFALNRPVTTAEDAMTLTVDIRIAFRTLKQAIDLPDCTSRNSEEDAHYVCYIVC